MNIDVFSMKMSISRWRKPILKPKRSETPRKTVTKSTSVTASADSADLRAVTFGMFPRYLGYIWDIFWMFSLIETDWNRWTGICWVTFGIFRTRFLVGYFFWIFSISVFFFLVVLLFLSMDISLKLAALHVTVLVEVKMWRWIWSWNWRRSVLSKNWIAHSMVTWLPMEYGYNQQQYLDIMGYNMMFYRILWYNGIYGWWQKPRSNLAKTRWWFWEMASASKDTTWDSDAQRWGLMNWDYFPQDMVIKSDEKCTAGSPYHQIIKSDLKIFFALW